MKNYLKQFVSAFLLVAGMSPATTQALEAGNAVTLTQRTFTSDYTGRTNENVKSDEGPVINTTATVTWPFNEGTLAHIATFAPEVTGGYFKNYYDSYGSSLTNKGARADAGGLTQTLFQPIVNGSSSGEESAINFMIVPKTGLKFTPRKISFKSTRWGTNGGNIAVYWLNSDGTTVTLATDEKPVRDNAGTNTEYNYNVTGAIASEDACGLRINIYNLGTTKQTSFADVVIEGDIEGTILNIKQCKFDFSANPKEAGTIKVNPVGNEFDENTELTLTQTRNFGYKFKNWTDTDGNVLGESEQLTYTLTEDIKITANYEKIPTYELKYIAGGEAKEYMITPTPAPEVVDGKYMYEEGTTATLSASSNKILTFTGWSNGDTASEIMIDMTQDQTITANYSATDFIAGWDFYEAGGSGRKADFASADNDADALILRDTEGTINGWLDKSQMAAGGYEGRPAAVNWRNTVPIGTFYWQIMVNASAFTELKVSSAMLYNYNAYTKYNVEYSLNGNEWTKIGTIEIKGSKNWIDSEFDLPADANNQAQVYIRWIADKTSPISGTESTNDGNAIADIYVTGIAELIDDGTAPVLESTLPTDGTATVSANGKIVLTFDEKVKLSEGAQATLGDAILTPSVVGKTVICEYKGLAYGTSYTFTLPGNTVSDLTDNTVEEAIIINFTTKTRPTISKAYYDFIVPTDGTISEALSAAAKRNDVSKRFRIFVMSGNYRIPVSETETVVGSNTIAYPSPITRINTPNISIIGEDINNTTIVNTVPEVTSGSNPIEGLGKCATFSLEKNATNTYMQDITIKNGLYDATGRGAALEDRSNKTICKNVGLYGYQDTYLSNNENGRFYFEGGALRGRTDFLCGKGDVYYNAVNLVMCEKGGYIAVPSKPTKYGYIFKDCIVKGEKSDINGNFTLGRPWGSGTPIALFIDTKMEVVPSAIGWAEMSGGYPTRFAEYNSTTSTGSVINLNNRKTIFGDGHRNNPILTAEEAAEMTLTTVMGGNDDWDPTAATEQTSAPTNVNITDNVITWDNNDYALLWAICKNDKIVAFTIEPTYTINDAKAKYSIRAANEMGGLGEATVAFTDTGINEIGINSNVIKTTYFNLQGIEVDKSYNGIVIRVEILNNGNKVTAKIIR